MAICDGSVFDKKVLGVKLPLINVARVEQDAAVLAADGHYRRYQSLSALLSGQAHFGIPRELDLTT